jgi:uncharacterized protein (DUF2252 family)
MTRAERRELGRAARSRAPRAQHAVYDPGGDRADPVALLERQARTRVRELVPIRYARMLTSRLAFYRGAALIMASDLAATPRSGLVVQCCGDAHLSNFGVFASPERRLVFDINDFDETLPGPWEWDVKRLATSVLIAARENDFSASAQSRATLATVAAYRKAMTSFAGMRNLEVWYAHLDVDETLERFGSQLRPRIVKQTKRALAKARARDSLSAFSKLARPADGGMRIVADPPLIVPVADLAPEAGRAHVLAWLNELLDSYRASLSDDRRRLLAQFALTDFARKVVGVGSVGTRAWIALLVGADGDDPLMLQLKEAQASVLEEFLQPSEFENHGERVVTGQRLMQASSDILLGWVRVEGTGEDPGGDFYGRQLRDWKGSAEVEQMSPAGLVAYGRLCGWTLARAHARTGDRIMIDGYLGKGAKFDHAIAAFAESYAEQNERDYEALAAAVRAGRVEAQGAR